MSAFCICRGAGNRTLAARSQTVYTTIMLHPEAVSVMACNSFRKMGHRINVYIYFVHHFSKSKLCLQQDMTEQREGASSAYNPTYLVPIGNWQCQFRAPHHSTTF